MRKLVLIVVVVTIVLLVLYNKGMLNDKGEDVVESMIENIIDNPKLKEVSNEALSEVLGDKVTFNEDGTFEIDFKSLSVASLKNLLILLEE